MRADLAAGAGFCFLDPHGDASLAIAAATPRERTNDVIYLDPSDPTHTFAYNPLAGVAPADRATSAANIVSAFKNIWADSWGPRLDYVLSNALRLLLDSKDQSLIGIPRLFFDDQFRSRLLQNCADPVIRFYWQHEFEALDPRLARRDAFADPKQDRHPARQSVHPIRALPKHVDDRHRRRDELGQGLDRQSVERKSRHRARAFARRAFDNGHIAGGRGATDYCRR